LAVSSKTQCTHLPDLPSSSKSSFSNLHGSSFVPILLLRTRFRPVLAFFLAGVMRLCITIAPAGCKVDVDPDLECKAPPTFVWVRAAGGGVGRVLTAVMGIDSPPPRLLLPLLL
jgi:hypothetical protein